LSNIWVTCLYPLLPFFSLIIRFSGARRNTGKAWCLLNTPAGIFPHPCSVFFPFSFFSHPFGKECNDTTANGEEKFVVEAQYFSLLLPPFFFSPPLQPGSHHSSASPQCFFFFLSFFLFSGSVQCPSTCTSKICNA